MLKMTYDEWDKEVSVEIRAEPVWKFAGYRKALFLNELIWTDSESWLNDPRGRASAQQIVDSIGSISANIEEGYGRGYGKQLLLFYTYALASARESKGWYFRSRRFLHPTVLTHRLKLCDEIIALLVDELNCQRRHQR
jgi:four helix bundle protein